jgi:hypothetical protein
MSPTATSGQTYAATAVVPAVVRCLVGYLRGLNINVLLRWQQTPNRGITATGVGMNRAAALAASVQQGDDETTGVPVRVRSWLSTAFMVMASWYMAGTGGRTAAGVIFCRRNLASAARILVQIP